MPNVKIFVDDTRYASMQEALSALLPDLRTFLCSSLMVDNAACQLAVIPVMGVPDQPQVNVEIHLMPRPERTRASIIDLADGLRDVLGKATGQHVAVRVTTLDPASYLALK